MQTSNNIIVKICGLAICLLWQVTVFAQSPKQLKRMGLEAFESQEYQKAADLLADYMSSKPNDRKVLLKLVKSQYQIGQCDEALNAIQSLVEAYPKNGDYLLMLARVLHKKQDFPAAIKAYKSYLKWEDEEDGRQEIVNDLKRAWIGQQHRIASKDVLVENLGTNVNGPFDDFHPVISSTNSSRIYFSSNRPRESTIQLDDIFPDTLYTTSEDQDSYKTGDNNILRVELENGVWTSPSTINDRLNTEKNEELECLSSNGQMAYFRRGSRKETAPYLVDSFSVEMKMPQGSPLNHMHIYGNEGDRDLYQFDDSTFIFSSMREGGYGGYDLYLTTFRNGRWHLYNFGPKINSAYDEISPFLSKNGRVIYFSSNSLASMGGYDIFKSDFDLKTYDWAGRENLGLPINSASDDMYYRLNSEGTSAFFSSNRLGGSGQYDIYSAYYIKPLLAQKHQLVPALFLDIEDYHAFQSELTDGSGAVDSLLLDQKPIVELPAIYYTADEVVLSPFNKKNLNKYVELSKSYPHLELYINSYSDDLALNNLNLYFSMTRAETIAQYLVDQGVSRDKIHLYAYGGQYPAAKAMVNNKINPVGKGHNRRFDIYFSKDPYLPVRLEHKRKPVLNSILDPSLNTWERSQKGLRFRIKYYQGNQLYKGDLVEDGFHNMIEKEKMGGQYNYYIFHLDKYDEARKALVEMRTRGYENAQMAVFLDGKRFYRRDIDAALLDKYPELKRYILQ